MVLCKICMRTTHNEPLYNNNTMCRYCYENMLEEQIEELNAEIMDGNTEKENELSNLLNELYKLQQS